MKNKEIFSRIVYEDNDTMVFLVQEHDAEGHMLVIPKKHYESILDCDTDTLSRVMETVKRVSNHLVDNCGYEGVNILNANGLSAQQSVSHLYFHIIPRKKNDGLDVWPIMNNSTEDKDEYLERIRII